MTTSRIVRLALVLAVLLAFGAIAVSNGASPVPRVVLGSGDPPETGDDELALSRVTVPAGASLAAHTHPGLQIATITSGRLTYTVVRGRATVRRASGRVVRLRSGRTVVLRPGDSITEPGGMVHRARNRGRARVVIILASLFPAGAPLSTPVGGASARERRAPREGRVAGPRPTPRARAGDQPRSGCVSPCSAQIRGTLSMSNSMP